MKNQISIVFVTSQDDLEVIKYARKVLKEKFPDITGFDHHVKDLSRRERWK